MAQSRFGDIHDVQMVDTTNRSLYVTIYKVRRRVQGQQCVCGSHVAGSIAINAFAYLSFRLALTCRFCKKRGD